MTGTHKLAAILGVTAMSVVLLVERPPEAAPSARPFPSFPQAPGVAAMSERDLVRFALLCMNHGNARLEWDEPHTEDKRASMCNTYSFPRAK